MIQVVKKEVPIWSHLVPGVARCGSGLSGKIGGSVSTRMAYGSYKKFDPHSPTAIGNEKPLHGAAAA